MPQDYSQLELAKEIANGGSRIARHLPADGRCYDLIFHQAAAGNRADLISKLGQQYGYRHDTEAALQYLRKAVERGDAAMLEALYSCGAEARHADRDLALLAASTGQVDCLRVLKEHRYDLHQTGDTALIAAFIWDQAEAAAFLLAEGADYRTYDHQILRSLSRSKDPSCLELLLTQYLRHARDGADPIPEVELDQATDIFIATKERMLLEWRLEGRVEEVKETGPIPTRDSTL